MHRLYSSGKYSDFVIVCRGTEFKVHRAVVCLQSKPLAAVVDGEFEKANTGEIILDDNEPEIVECMLKYLYTSNYSDGGAADKLTVTPNARLTARRSTRSSLSSPSRLNAASNVTETVITNAKVYIIADLFDIQGLKDLAKNKYEDALTDDWNSTSFVASIKLLYEGTTDADRLLKNAAIRAVCDHVEELVDQGEFAALCKEKGEIAFDILKASLGAKSKSCLSCGLGDYIQVAGYRSVYCAVYNCEGCGRAFD